MITVKDFFWQELHFFILSNITSFWMKTEVMLNPCFQLAASVTCKIHSTVSVVTEWVSILMVFPDLIYRIKCNFLSSAMKFVSFLHELKVYNILFSFIHDKLKGMQMWLHTQESGFSSERRRVLGVWNRTPIWIFPACHLQFPNLEQPLKGRRTAILWMGYEQKPPRDYIWKSKLFSDGSISS